MFKLLALFAILATASASAIKKPKETWSQFELDALSAHNTYRAKHSSPALVLDRSLCNFAQEWANYLAANDIFDHRPDNEYGENLYASTGSVNGQSSVSSWYNEIKDYDFNNPGFSMETGHFTQVVWKDSKRLGIAKATGSKWTYVVANYDPPGNYEGEFEVNVLPPQ